jgi:hypothetical protein
VCVRRARAFYCINILNLVLLVCLYTAVVLNLLTWIFTGTCIPCAHIRTSSSVVGALCSCSHLSAPHTVRASLYKSPGWPTAPRIRVPGWTHSRGNNATTPSGVGNTASKPRLPCTDVRRDTTSRGEHVALQCTLVALVDGARSHHRSDAARSDHPGGIHASWSTTGKKTPICYSLADVAPACPPWRTLVVGNCSWPAALWEQAHA